MLRITSGVYKGRMLDGMDSIRSTKCIVREAIFNIVYSSYHEMLEGTILDLYGGTGMVSYEAMSRGAKKAIINDINPVHRKVAMQNAFKLGVADRVTFSAQDALRYRTNFDEVDIVFIDPPYYKDFGHATVENIVNHKSSEKRILIIIELCKEDMRSFLEVNSTYPEPRRYGRSYLQMFVV